jgi:hypothetical protein
MAKKKPTAEQQARYNHLIKTAASICLCGHTGDGKDSDHAGLIGHGACCVPDCICRKFTWKRFIKDL